MDLQATNNKDVGGDIDFCMPMMLFLIENINPLTIAARCVRHQNVKY